MYSKVKYALLALFLILAFGPSKKEYSNELEKFSEVPLQESKYNFDKYNDFVVESQKYYKAFLKYIDFAYFKSIDIEKNNNYYHEDVSLFYLDNRITFYKQTYSLSIEYSSSYVCYQLITDKSFYWYFSNVFLDFRVDNKVYFIKDKYRVSYLNNNFNSILSYEENYYLNSNLYRIQDDSLKEIKNQEKEVELLTIANIYLTEYF